MNLFSVVCFLPGLRIAHASHGQRHAIRWTAYKVTEAKTENGDSSNNDKYMNSMVFFKVHRALKTFKIVFRTVSENLDSMIR